MRDNIVTTETPVLKPEEYPTMNDWLEAVGNVGFENRWQMEKSLLVALQEKKVKLRQLPRWASVVVTNI